ncbi:uncharacterized protein BKCO1_1100001 [Diplodia corticola]|uniref:Uncharacterized protein n=1 Tax=Diplodia corticola TaxID=236234 RepID=A0A1J9QJZ6_9PEZI|nr:uncharacterized protein BKCO1_1100001 [Diplodia corticola]OJD28808.1 hypothetical protein BKCO1_1100001 [Diplodia corticola]
MPSYVDPQSDADKTRATRKAPVTSHEHPTNELKDCCQPYRSSTGSSETDREETPLEDLWKPPEHRPDYNPLTAWTPDFWRVDANSRYGRRIFRSFIFPCIAGPSPLKSRREAIPWADEFVQQNYRVYRGFPETEKYHAETNSKSVIGRLADLINAFYFHVYRRSFRKKVTEGKTQPIQDLREHLYQTLNLDRKGLVHSNWTSYNSLKPGGDHFETAIALWCSVMNNPGDGEAYRIELLGKRVAIFGASTFGIPEIQTLRDNPVRAVQLLQAHAKSVNPASHTFFDVLEEKERKIRDLESRLGRYKCIAADLYFRHILEQLPGSVPLDSNKRHTASATKQWGDFLKKAVEGADDVQHPLHPLLRLLDDKQKIARMLGEALYRSLSINIHHEFISLDSNTSRDGYGHIIPDLRYSKLEQALFKAILPSAEQAGAQPDWDLERDRYITTPIQGQNWRDTAGKWNEDFYVA